MKMTKRNTQMNRKQPRGAHVVNRVGSKGDGLKIRAPKGGSAAGGRGVGR